MKHLKCIIDWKWYYNPIMLLQSTALPCNAAIEYFMLNFLSQTTMNKEEFESQISKQ